MQNTVLIINKLQFPSLGTNYWLFIFYIFLSIIESQPGIPSKPAKKEAELEATEGAAEQNSAETQSNGTAKEAAPAQRNIACLSDANTAGGGGQREVVVSANSVATKQT